jgi:hypothetical protein
MFLRGLSITCAAVVMLQRAPCQSQEHGNTERTGESSVFSANAELHRALAAARDEAEWPGLTVSRAARTLQTPNAILRFVRDGIAVVSYPGSYQSPDATLRTRVANSVDKARLLAAMLGRHGYETELVSAMPIAIDKAHRPTGIERPRPAMAELKFLLTDFAPARESQDSSRDRTLRSEMANHAAVDKEVETALELLKTELANRKWKARPAARSRPPQPDQWVLVRSRKPGEDWRLFDVYSELAAIPSQFSSFQLDPASVSLRVDAMTAADEPVPLIKWDGLFADLAGQDLRIQWYPCDSRLLSGADLVLPLDIRIKEWRPALRFGGERVLGDKFDPTSAVRIRLSIHEKPGANSEQSPLTCVRTLQHCSDGFDQHEMFAVHRVSIAVAGVPSSVVECRVLDELNDLQLLAEWLEDGKSPDELSRERGISTRTACVINKLMATVLRLDRAGQQLEWNGPSIVMETTRLGKLDGDIVSVTLLDQLNASLKPRPASTVDFMLRYGLATCAAEAELVGGRSVNRELQNSRGLVDAGDADTSRQLEPLDVGRDDLVLTQATDRRFAWIVRSNGLLQGVVTERPLLAKGGRSATGRVEIAGGALLGLGSATLAAGGASAVGPVAGGVAGYLFALRRAYRGIVGRLEDIGTAIEFGDASILTNRNDVLRDIVRDLLNGFGIGYATGYGVSVAGAGLSGYLGAGPRGSATIAGGLSIGSQAMLLSDRDVQAASRGSNK